MLSNEVGKDLGISVFTGIDIQDEMRGPTIFEEYRKNLSKKFDGAYVCFPASFRGSIIQDFQSYPKIDLDLIEDGIRLVSKESISKFITNELKPAIYSSKNLSEVQWGSHQNGFEANHSINKDYANIRMKTN